MPQWFKGEWMEQKSEYDPTHIQMLQGTMGYKNRFGVRSSPVMLSMWPCKKISWIQVWLFTFSNPTQKTKTGTANRWETTNSNPPGPIKLSSQSTAGVRFCCAFYLPQHPVQKCWAKTVVLSQTSMFWLFFIQFSFAGPHTEHQWSYSYMLLLKEGR
jgi:hypothetical protein